MIRITVVAGVIYNPAKTQILISLRAPDKHQGSLWEFPGGKMESGESRTSALARELLEELGIEPTAYAPLVQIVHDYTDKSVLLDVWEVTAYRGTPAGRESQEVRWVPVSELSNYDFPAANAEILDLIH